MTAFSAKYGARKRICNKYHLENSYFDIKLCLDISRASRCFFFVNTRVAFPRQGEEGKER